MSFSQKKKEKELAPMKVDRSHGEFGKQEATEKPLTDMRRTGVFCSKDYFLEMLFLRLEFIGNNYIL